VDKRRIRDLEQLKVLGGPFTASEQVDVYIQKRNINEHTKTDRLYLEVVMLEIHLCQCLKQVIFLG